MKQVEPHWIGVYLDGLGNYWARNQLRFIFIATRYKSQQQQRPNYPCTHAARTANVYRISGLAPIIKPISHTLPIWHVNRSGAWTGGYEAYASSYMRQSGRRKEWQGEYTHKQWGKGGRMPAQRALLQTNGRVVQRALCAEKKIDGFLDEIFCRLLLSLSLFLSISLFFSLSFFRFVYLEHVLRQFT